MNTTWGSGPPGALPTRTFPDFPDLKGTGSSHMWSILQETQEREMSPGSDNSSLALAAWKLLSLPQDKAGWDIPAQMTWNGFSIPRDVWQEGRDVLLERDPPLVLLGFVPWSNIRPCLRSKCLFCF